MGFYAKYVLPRLLDLAMRKQDMTRLRAESIPLAHGDVLEVGVGSGLNLPFYTSEVQRIYGVDPSVELQAKARERMAKASREVEFFTQSAEAPIALPDASIDTAVITWSLCTIPDPARALRQIKRVLKPGGSLIFIEHGRSPDADVAKWQDRVNPVWRPIGGGCNLNREPDKLIESAGFQIDEMKTFYNPGPRPVTFTYQGRAHAEG
jgi:ubiquinone/menaquinone biosynthesis C-methylase UbiE